MLIFIRLNNENWPHPMLTNLEALRSLDIPH
jgi:hypothetical protein